MTHPSRHELDEILTHRAWVAGLARSLLFDQAQVDDVVQETWMLALKSRPRDPAATWRRTGSEFVTVGVGDVETVDFVVD